MWNQTSTEPPKGVPLIVYGWYGVREASIVNRDREMSLGRYNGVTYSTHLDSEDDDLIVTHWQLAPQYPK